MTAVRGALHAFALVWVCFAWPVSAQALDLAANGQPIEISADNGIEWRRDDLVFLARGNAKAVNGAVTVHADELRAYYRKKGGGTDIYRLDAVGGVRIVGRDATAHGGKAVYDIEKAVLVLSEGDLRLETETDVVTARKQIEYWETKKMAVARGDAKATRAEKTLRADVLTARFAENKAGASRIHKVEAFDRVRVRTATEEAFARRGVYNVDTGIAILTGDVTITKDQDVIKGCSAKIDMNTDVSTMLACGDSTGQRVRGTFTPKRSKQDG